jgi:predicted amidohydrolase
MKVAYVQFEPALADSKASIARLKPLLNDVIDADLVVLPELAHSGYYFKDRAQAEECAETLDGPFCTFLKNWCRSTDTYVVAGWNERADAAIFNSAVLVGPDGVEGVYRKIHLFNREKLYFASGDRDVPIFKIRGATIAMLICFDWIFPEVWRVAALKGAQIICHPSNLVLPGMAQQGVPAHSLMNRVFCITANRVGVEGELHFTGNSIITNARGEVICSADKHNSETGIVEINPEDADDKMVTERNDLLQDRRPEFYHELLGIEERNQR